MKRITITICLMLLALVSKAQPGRFDPDEMIRMQTQDIVSWLKLEGETRDKFVKDYVDFRKEIDAVARDARPPQKFDGEDEIDKAIQNNFEVSEKILQIRKKYYLCFKAYLKPSQIQMMYRAENESGRRMPPPPPPQHTR